jgi:hypothetical protein
MRRAPHEGLQPATLAAEGQQLVVAALAAAQPQKPVGQDAALEEGVELVLDEAGQLGPGTGFDMGDEAGRVLPHQPVQRGLLWAVALVEQRAACGVAQPRQREREHLARPKYCRYLQSLSAAKTLATAPPAVTPAVT